MILHHTEEATGMQQHGKLRMFHRSDKENPITIERARELILAGEEVEIPTAGAGNAGDVARLLGLGEIEPADMSSSAGDWAFTLPGQPGNKMLWQRNRYPHFGFGYTIAEV